MVHRFGALFLFMTFLSFLGIGLSFHTPYAFVLVILGWVSGFVLGGAMALMELSSLSRNGESRATLNTLAYMIVVLIVGIALFYLFGAWTLDPAIKILNFALSGLAAQNVAYMILFRNWEKKHERLILAKGSWLNRIYVFPEIHETQDIKQH